MHVCINNACYMVAKQTVISYGNFYVLFINLILFMEMIYKIDFVDKNDIYI